jgi:hypothetical protein
VTGAVARVCTGHHQCWPQPHFQLKEIERFSGSPSSLSARHTNRVVEGTELMDGGLPVSEEALWSCASFAFVSALVAAAAAHCAVSLLRGTISNEEKKSTLDAHHSDFVHEIDVNVPRAIVHAFLGDLHNFAPLHPLIESLHELPRDDKMPAARRYRVVDRVPLGPFKIRAECVLPDCWPLLTCWLLL